jgi:hypothetical protein
VCFAGAAEKSSKHGAEDKAQSVMTGMKQRVCDKPEIFELLRYKLKNYFLSIVEFKVKCVIMLVRYWKN